MIVSKISPVTNPFRQANTRKPIDSCAELVPSCELIKTNSGDASLLIEARAAVTPMNGDLRLAGVMEIGSNNSYINIQRVKGYLSKIKDYLTLV